MSRINRTGEGSLVSVEAAEDRLEERRGAIGVELGAFVVAVELEELREQREDEGEGDLDWRSVRRRAGSRMDG